MKQSNVEATLACWRPGWLDERDVRQQLDYLQRRRAITGRDEAILEMVNVFGAMSGPQIHALFWPEGSWSTAERRLRTLAGPTYGLLFRPPTTGDEVFTLGQAGYLYLGEELTGARLNQLRNPAWVKEALKRVELYRSVAGIITGLGYNLSRQGEVVVVRVGRAEIVLEPAREQLAGYAARLNKRTIVVSSWPVDYFRQKLSPNALQAYRREWTPGSLGPRLLAALGDTSPQQIVYLCGGYLLNCELVAQAAGQVGIARQASLHGYYRGVQHSGKLVKDIIKMYRQKRGKAKNVAAPAR